MVGFVKRFFDRKPQATATQTEATTPDEATAPPEVEVQPVAVSQPEIVAPPEPKPAAPQDRSNAFFLDPDEAKTLGNIDYMRTPRKIVRTYASADKSKELEYIQEVSAMGRSSASRSKPTAGEQSGAKSSASEKPKIERRKPSGTDMDSFRNMARDIRNPKSGK